MKKPIGFGLLAVVIIVAGCGGDGQDERQYVAANQEILDDLPVFPGATIGSKSDNPYYLDEQGGVSGWSTNVVYRVADEVTDEEVIQFYIDEMAGWENCREEAGIANAIPTGQPLGTPLGKILLASFVRDKESVSVNTDGLNPVTRSNTFEIGIDHNSYQNRCTGEYLR